jgi:hypothetical protein
MKENVRCCVFLFLFKNEHDERAETDGGKAKNKENKHSNVRSMNGYGNMMTCDSQRYMSQ